MLQNSVTSDVGNSAGYPELRQGEHTSPLVLFSRTRNTGLVTKEKKTSDKPKLRDILQNISTLQNCQGHEKQDRLKKPSEIRGDKRRHNDQIKCILDILEQKKTLGSNKAS